MKLISASFSVHTDLLSLHFEPGRMDRFVLRQEAGSVAVLYPPSFRFDDVRVQPWLRRVLVEVLRAQACMVLLPRFKMHMERTGLCPGRVVIKQVRSCWGSCSARRNINLSLFLMLLPARFADYVMLHELCHLKEMNHSARFWALLDGFTGGQAVDLRRELREYVRREGIGELMYACSR